MGFLLDLLFNILLAFNQTNVRPGVARVTSRQAPGFAPGQVIYLSSSSDIEFLLGCSGPFYYLAGYSLGRAGYWDLGCLYSIGLIGLDWFYYWIGWFGRISNYWIRSSGLDWIWCFIGWLAGWGVRPARVTRVIIIVRSRRHFRVLTTFIFGLAAFGGVD